MSEIPSDYTEVGRVADALGRALQGNGEELVSCIARTARAVFGAAACSIALLSDDGTELVFTTVSGVASDTVSGMRIGADQGIAGWVATTGQPLAVSDLTHDPRFAANVASATGYMPRAILASPVETDERLIGVIEVLDRDELRTGSEQDLELLALFARQAALAIHASEQARRIGDVLLRALADSGAVDFPTALAALEHRAPADDTLITTAAAFARLAAAGPDERALAARLLEDVADFAARPRQ